MNFFFLKYCAYVVGLFIQDPGRSEPPPSQIYHKSHLFAVQVRKGKEEKKLWTCFLYFQSILILLGIFYIVYLRDTAQPRKAWQFKYLRGKTDLG